MIRKYQRSECVLCDEVHELQVHAYLERKVRSPNDGENHAIRILSIICARAKAQGQQPYTKRLLPEFVIPECNIRLDRVLVLVEEDPQENRNEDWSCGILGCVDGRTVGRHREWIQLIVAKTLKLGYEVLVQLPSFGVLPEAQIGDREYGQLLRVRDALQQAAARMYGWGGEPVAVIEWVQGVYWWVRSRKTLPVPLHRVVSATGFFDTS